MNRSRANPVLKREMSAGPMQVPSGLEGQSSLLQISTFSRKAYCGEFLCFVYHPTRPIQATQDLIEAAATKWREVEGDYRDDITAVVIRLPCFPE